MASSKKRSVYPPIHKHMPPSIDQALAMELGDIEALFLFRMFYWLNKCGRKNFYDGRLWMYNTYLQWARDLPFPRSARTIGRAIHELRALQLIKTIQPKKHKGYMVNHYSPDFPKIEALLKRINSRFHAWFVGFKESFFNCIKTMMTKWHDKQGLTLSKEVSYRYNEAVPVDKTGPPTVLLEKEDGKKAKDTPEDEKLVEINDSTRRAISFQLKNLKSQGKIPARILEKGLDVLADEVVYHLSRYKQFKLRSVQHALNCALKLIREDKWQTPYGFSFCLEELSHAQKQKDLEHLRGLDGGTTIGNPLLDAIKAVRFSF